jgi:peptidoglycan/LPS O-acetylase OafA/YrhL
MRKASRTSARVAASLDPRPKSLRRSPWCYMSTPPNPGISPITEDPRAARDAANNFTLVRLILALLVVLGHFQGLGGVAQPPFPFNYAAAAVDCFFVVSGYLVTSSFDRDPDLGRFYLRRVCRIYPLYLAVVLAQTVILALLAWQRGVLHFWPLLRYFAVNAVFANFLQHDLGGVLSNLTDPGFNPSLWTLKIEFGFYLILPFLWLLTRRFGFRFLVPLFVASAFYYFLLTKLGHYELAKQLPGQLQLFAVGMAIYRIEGKIRLSQAAAVVATIGLAIVLTMLLPYRPPLLYPLVVGALVGIACLRTPAVRVHTDISYGVYLVHGPIIQLALLTGWYFSGLLGLSLILVPVLAIALLGERWVERPGIALGRRPLPIWLQAARPGRNYAS